MLYDATTVNLQNLISGHKDAVIYFSASWCTPCKHFGPVVEKVARKMPHLPFFKVNIEDAPMANELGVKAVPTIVVIRKASVVFQKAGVLTEDALVSAINITSR